MSKISDRRQQLEEELRQREEISQVVSTAGRRFLTSQNWQDSLPEVLPPLARAVGVRAIYALRAAGGDGGALAPQLFYEWLNDEPSSRRVQSGQAAPGEIQKVFSPLEQMPVEKQVFKGRMQEMPQLERDYFQGKGIESFMVIPIFAGQSWWGLLGFGDVDPEREWSTVEEDALELVANLLGAAIEHQKMNDERRELYDTEHEQRRLAQILSEVGTALSSTLDFEQVLDMLLDQIKRVVPYDSASVILVDGEKATPTRWRGYERYIKKKKLMDALRQPFDLSETGSLHRMMDQQQAIFVSDTAADPAWVKRPSAAHVRSWVGTPVIAQGQVIAFLSLDKVESGFYNEKHVRLLEAFAGQAALAMQNARSFAEMSAALRREKTLNETVIAVSSALDLPTILQTVARLAAELVKADTCVLGVLGEDGESFVFEYGVNIPESMDRKLIRPGGLGMQVIRTGKSIIMPEYNQWPNARPDLIAAGAHGLIGVPLQIGEEMLGVLMLTTLNPNLHFSEHELALIESMGRQIAVAVKNTRLYEAAQRRARETETLLRATSAITSNMKLKDVVNAIQEQLAQVVPFNSSSLFLARDNMLYIAATSGEMANEAMVGATFPLENDLFQEVARSHAPLVLADVQNDPRFHNWGGIPIRGWMAVPLFTRDELIGILTLDSSRANAYTPADATLVQAFANEAAVAVDNARLFEQVQHMAITDPLTEIYNRRYFFEAAEREFQRARRYASPLSILLLDIDYFKKVNDTHGHLVGDEVLRALAKHCQKDLREVDVMARYGGEEFAVLLPETDLAHACQVALRLQGCVQQNPALIGGRKIPISVSIGSATLEDDSQNLEELVNRADKALYGAKTRGRGRICVWAEGKIETLNDPGGVSA